MSRYLLFVGEDYYPSGGWNDFRGSFATLEEAQSRVFDPSDTDYKFTGDWAQIVDLETLAIVDTGRMRNMFAKDAYFLWDSGAQYPPPDRIPTYNEMKAWVLKVAVEPAVVNKATKPYPLITEKIEHWFQDEFRGAPSDSFRKILKDLKQAGQIDFNSDSFWYVL